MPTQKNQPNSHSLSNVNQEQQQVKRRRYRIPRSCDRCRTSKIKCVFQDGQCAACFNARVPCTFANPGSLKERPPTQKDVEHLKARIRSLERLIHAVDPDFDLSAAPELINLQHMDSSTELIRSPYSSLPSSSSKKRSTSFSYSHDPQSSALSSLFFPTQIRVDSSVGSLQFSLVYGEHLSPADKIIRQQYANMLYWNDDLYPEPDLEQSLIKSYFEKIHPSLPLLHPATFLQDFKSGLLRTSHSFRALCFGMMAIASRFSKDPRVFLDLDGIPQRSPQVAGLRFATVALSYLLQPISAPADLHDLQVTLIMVIYTLGTASADTAWNMTGLGLQRAQESGAHLENSSKWSSSSLQDHLRRKAFMMLYEFDCLLSAAIGKPAYMQESDFDVSPHDLDFEIAIGTFSNPFNQSTAASAEKQEDLKIANDIGLAYEKLKSSVEGLKNLFPLIDLMNARKDSYPSIQFSSCIELLINQLDTSVTKCYEKVARNFRAHESSNANVTDHQLVSSVHAVTWYHEFRLLSHKLLISSSGAINTPSEESEPTAKHNQESSALSVVSNSHAIICFDSARMILILINRLHQRNLLELGFYWIPLRLTNALIFLIIALMKCKGTMPADVQRSRHYEISLGIEIMNALAPSTFLADQCSKLIAKFQDAVL